MQHDGFIIADDTDGPVVTSRGRVSRRPLEFWKNERFEYDINKEVKSFSQASLAPTPLKIRRVSFSDGSAKSKTPASSRGAPAAPKRQQPPATSASAAQSRSKRIAENMEAPPEKSEWTGTHTWTIDYVKMCREAKKKNKKNQSWLHSDPFVIGGHEFTFMVSATGCEKNDSTPFGVFLCPSKQLSGCLLTRFKIHLRFNGVDPLPSGQSACKDFWGDETKGGCLNWGFQPYCPSVTHRDLVNFQDAANSQIMLEVMFWPPTSKSAADPSCSCTSKYARILKNSFKKASNRSSPATRAQKRAMSA